MIKKPHCNAGDGSITGVIITSSGTKVTYTWHDQDGAIVGHSVNLTNISEGTYTLVVTDNSGCASPVLSQPFVVQSINGVEIDESNVTIKQSSCSNDGSITGIMVSGASTYKWRNLTTDTVLSTSGTTADLFNLAPGQYQLAASNSSCQKISAIYTVKSSFEVPQVVSSKITANNCGGFGGSITVSLKVSSTQPRLNAYFVNNYGYRTDVADIMNAVSDPTYVIKADVATYSFYVRDPVSNCTVLLGQYEVPGGELDFSKPIITNDRCNQHLGIINPNVQGFTSTKGNPNIPIWTDTLTGQVVGKDMILTHVGAGVYKLNLIVGGGACRGSAVYTILNVEPALVPPKAAGTTICTPGMINITVTNVDTSKLFRLYDSPASDTPIDSSKVGIFYRNVDQTTDFYVTRVSKDCESDRTKVTEVVVASFSRPNAFTPNGDGVNDFWNLNGIDKFPGADIKIFTRNGQMIYHSLNYAVPFDGTYNGHQLPAGVYYYIIDLKQPICYGKISGSLTIIR